MKYLIKTFGCAQNIADSERVAAAFMGRGMTEATDYEDANYVIINTCMVRESAENRVFGLVENLAKIKERKLQNNDVYKIIVTGCMVGVAFRDKSGKYFDKIRRVLPEVDEFMPIEEVGFDTEPIRTTKEIGLVPISNGCNNFCTFCIVPFTRGREISRPFDDIIQECTHLRLKGYKSVLLLGQNVNSYGADLVVGEKNIQVMRDIDKTYFETDFSEVHDHPQRNDVDIYTVKGKELKPIYVKHLGRYRIPTLFPHLLEEVAKLGFEKVDFMSSNPWDFSDELIEVIAKNPNITRTFHVAVQSGDNKVLKRMNRWYTAEDFVKLTEKIRGKIPNAVFTTDIIVGFCGETEEEFKNTVQLVKKVQFQKAYISRYSQRPMTAATKVFDDNVPADVKKRRWDELDAIINKPHLLKRN
ncbi:MAG: radical SAM protein [Patescibacteria group bacterium]